MPLYRTQGVCSQAIDLEIEGGKVVRARFLGGCPGNTAGIERLVVGMDAEGVRERLADVDCCGRGTSCPDQLARAIGSAIRSQSGGHAR